jgi:hypothetical protein
VSCSIVFHQTGNETVDRAADQAAAGHQHQAAPDAASKSTAQNETGGSRHGQRREWLAVNLAVAPDETLGHCTGGRLASVARGCFHPGSRRALDDLRDGVADHERARDRNPRFILDEADQPAARFTDVTAALDGIVARRAVDSFARVASFIERLISSFIDSIGHIIGHCSISLISISDQARDTSAKPGERGSADALFGRRISRDESAASSFVIVRSLRKPIAAAIRGSPRLPARITTAPHEAVDRDSD